jgi:hypothetical protein
MNKDGYGFFDMNDIPVDDEQSPLAKALTFEQTDVFAEAPDTTSEFHRAHTAEAADRLDKLFMSHGVGEPSGDERYEQLDPEFRTLLEKSGLGRDCLRAMAREAIQEEGL